MDFWNEAARTSLPFTFGGKNWVPLGTNGEVEFAGSIREKQSISANGRL